MEYKKMIVNFFQKHAKTCIDELQILEGSALAAWQLIKLVEKLTYTGELKSLRLCRTSSVVSSCKSVSDERVKQLIQRSRRINKLYVETYFNIHRLSYLTKMMEIDELHLKVSLCVECNICDHFVPWTLLYYLLVLTVALHT